MAKLKPPTKFKRLIALVDQSGRCFLMVPNHLINQLKGYTMTVVFCSGADWSTRPRQAVLTAPDDVPGHDYGPFYVSHSPWKPADEGGLRELVYLITNAVNADDALRPDEPDQPDPKLFRLTAVKERK